MPRRTGRRRVAAALVAGVVATALAFTAAWASRSGRPDAAPGAPPAPAPTATVERRDLVVREKVAAVLGFGRARPLVAARGGKLTAHPGPGVVVGRGERAYEVDGAGVALFLGDRPFWRPLAAGVTDGPDVRQLEDNLVALGVAPPSLAVDDRFTAATAAAIRRWQQARGLPVTGSFHPSDAVVHPGPLRVQEVTVPLGATIVPGAPVAQVTGAEALVSIELDGRRLALAPIGTQVPVVLPDGTEVTGVVVEVASAGSPPGEEPGGRPRFSVVVAAAIPEQWKLDQAPVTVRLQRQRAAGVLAVPIGALLAREGGGYAVERVAGDGRVERVAVDIGVVADGLVEVRGDLRGADTVAVAAT